MICFFHFISSYSISQGIRKHLQFTRWNSQESAINYVTFLNRTHHEWSIVLQIEELKILRREQYYNSIIILCGHALSLEKNITGRYSKVYRYIGKYRQITFRSFFFFFYQNKLTNTKKKKRLAVYAEDTISGLLFSNHYHHYYYDYDSAAVR